MNNWTSGYVTDIDYTYGYYQELNPLRSHLALTYAGLDVPQIETACELGFGQGLSTVIHAASSPVAWFGTDFNPSQVSFAQYLSRGLNTDTTLFDDSFEELCNRSDLPEFDFIGLHGIWSWISDENRKIIAKFIKEKLKPGGIAYVSYNVNAGWGSFIPLRELLYQHTKLAGSPSKGVSQNIDGALNFAKALLGANPKYLRANPTITERIAKMMKQDRSYLAHEFFNADWHPVAFSEIAGTLQEAKLDYGCSAHLLDHVHSINLSSEQQHFLSEVPEGVLRESALDLLTNQQFRRDYWVKGARKITEYEKISRIRNMQVVLQSDPKDIPMKVKGGQGEATLNEGIYKPFLDFVGDKGAVSIAEIEAALSRHDVTLSQVVQSAIVLAGAGHLGIAQDSGTVGELKPRVQELNKKIINGSKSSSDVMFLGSPVTGGGVSVGRFQQLFLLAYLEGNKEPASWAEYVWSILKEQGQLIMKEERKLETEKENLEELNYLANEFASKGLIVLNRLSVV